MACTKEASFTRVYIQSNNHKSGQKPREREREKLSFSNDVNCSFDYTLEVITEYEGYLIVRLR